MRVAIAIDGPAATGKSSVAYEISRRYNFTYINTGLMYRAITYICINQDIFSGDDSRINAILKDVEIDICDNKVKINGILLEDELRTDKIDKYVSIFADNVKVRNILISRQRDIAKNKNVVMDGRDIGTVVLKDANLKIFLWANNEVRAKRRYDELVNKGILNVSYDEILNQVDRRDKSDYNRKNNPLEEYSLDAIKIDTSYMTFSEVIEEISKYITDRNLHTQENNVILAENYGFCHGVVRAIKLLDETIDKSQFKNIYTFGEIIHNKYVINKYNQKGVKVLTESDLSMIDIKEGIIVIRAHGIPLDVELKLKESNISYVDGTCGKVKLIHKKVKEYYNNGYDIVLVGNSNHPELIGANSYCDYNAKFYYNGELQGDISEKVCVISQTTEKQENFKQCVELCKSKVDDVVQINTICDATDIRQQNAEDLAKQVDLMIVIGDKKSSNSNKLYEIASSNCSKAVMIESLEDIDDYLIDDIRRYNLKIGITAGASTPDCIIMEVVRMIDNISIDKNPANDEKKLMIGQIVTGKVISVNEDEATIDIGASNYAYLPKIETSHNEREKFINIFSESSEIEAKIISLKDVNGYIVLSRLEIYRDQFFEVLKEKFNNNEIITVFLKEDVKGGVIAEFNGIKLFVPASHMGLRHIEDLSQCIGVETQIKIIEIKEEKNQIKIIGSRRVVLEEEKKLAEDKVWDTLSLGEIVEGEVKRINTFGAFVDVRGLDGLLHISEISWGRIEKVSDILSIDDKIPVKIISIDSENNKLSLSMKALNQDPWNDINEKYPIGAVVLGKVIRFVEFGAFVELEPGVDALVHISQISHKRVNRIEDFLEIGNMVKAKIVDVNGENKRIELSIKSIE